MTVAAAALATVRGHSQRRSCGRRQRRAVVVEAYLAAWNAHDSAKAASYFADDVVYYDASVGKPIKGRMPPRPASSTISSRPCPTPSGR